MTNILVVYTKANQYTIRTGFYWWYFNDIY